MTYLCRVPDWGCGGPGLYNTKIHINPNMVLYFHKNKKRFYLINNNQFCNDFINIQD